MLSLSALCCFTDCQMPYLPTSRMAPPYLCLASSRSPIASSLLVIVAEATS